MHARIIVIFYHKMAASLVMIHSYCMVYNCIFTRNNWEGKCHVLRLRACSDNQWGKCDSCEACHIKSSLLS